MVTTRVSSSTPCRGQVQGLEVRAGVSVNPHCHARGLLQSPTARPGLPHHQLARGRGARRVLAAASLRLTRKPSTSCSNQLGRAGPGWAGLGWGGCPGRHPPTPGGKLGLQILTKTQT